MFKKALKHWGLTGYGSNTPKGSEADDDLLPVEEDDPSDADDAGGDFFDFLDKSNAEADACTLTAEGVFGVNGDVHDGNVGRSGAQENDDANWGLAFAVAVESEKGLGLV